MGTKIQFFNFPVYKIYLGMWARRAHRGHRACGHVGHIEQVGHVEDVGHVSMKGT